MVEQLSGVFKGRSNGSYKYHQFNSLAGRINETDAPDGSGFLGFLKFQVLDDYRNIELT